MELEHAMDIRDDVCRIFPGEHIVVGVIGPKAVGDFDACPVAAQAGIAVLAGDNVRHVYAVDNVHNHVDTLFMDNYWASYCFFFTPATGEFSQAQLAYLEDRLAHMFKLEDFETGTRIQRIHKLSQEEREQADKMLLLALAVAEDSMKLGLFVNDEAGPAELSTLTIPLTVENHGPLIP